MYQEQRTGRLNERMGGGSPGRGGEGEGNKGGILTQTNSGMSFVNF